MGGGGASSIQWQPYTYIYIYICLFPFNNRPNGPRVVQHSLINYMNFGCLNYKKCKILQHGRVICA